MAIEIETTVTTKRDVYCDTWADVMQFLESLAYDETDGQDVTIGFIGKRFSEEGKTFFTITVPDTQENHSTGLPDDVSATG